MVYELTDEQRELHVFMSDISERCWAAGWLTGTEYILWDAVMNGERTWGQRNVTHEDIQMLIELSQKYNCWIYFDDEKEETAVDLQTWEGMYRDAIAANPDLVKRYP